jgi:hypothetical protein
MPGEAIGFCEYKKGISPVGGGFFQKPAEFLLPSQVLFMEVPKGGAESRVFGYFPVRDHYKDCTENCRAGQFILI